MLLYFLLSGSKNYSGFSSKELILNANQKGIQCVFTFLIAITSACFCGFDVTVNAVGITKSKSFHFFHLDVCVCAMPGPTLCVCDCIWSYFWYLYGSYAIILHSNCICWYMLQLNEIRQIVSKMAGRGPDEVLVVASPYRICPLGAHIDHQVFLIHL